VFIVRLVVGIGLRLGLSRRLRSFIGLFGGIIEEKIVVGKKVTLIVLQVIENKMTIKLPAENIAKVGFRKVISDDDISEVYKILKMRNVKIDQTTWNRRYRDYSEKIKTGSIFEISEVLRDLFLLRHSKDLSFGERKMLDQAKAHIVKEISIAKRMQESLIEQEIQQIFSI
jgi:CarD family transcriptional regulator